MTGCAVAVIGHVDHGKTALVRALTGMETDRLAEEKARGLSISLGYAHRAYARGVLDIIDAPGHEDFIRAMVCGTTGAAAVLLVVSAIDGVQPQTREHLAIAGHLGLRRGVVAISRIDQIGPEARDACRSAIMEALSETPLGDAPVCLCSAMTGEGLGQLHAALAGLVESASALTPPSLPATFLPIDRVFSATGAGTVVTGTLQGARLARGAEMVLEASGRRAGVRGLQVNGLDVSVAMPGRRVAANLRGVQAGAVQRGDVLAAPGAFPASSCMDVRVALSPTASRALKHLDAVRLMIGTASEMAQIRLLAQQDIAPGRSGHAQIRLARPVSVHAGQHGILRWPSPGETLGGVTILDPCSRPARRGDAPRLALLDAIETGAPPAIAEALFEAGDGAAHEADIARLARQPLAELRAALAHRVVAEGRETGRVVSATSSRTAQAAYMAELSARHERAPLRPWVARENLRSALRGQVAPALVAHAEQALAAAGAIRLGQGRVAVAGHDPLAAMSQGERNRFEQLETDLRAGGLKPPPLRDLVDPGGADAALLELLTEAGRCVILENVSLRQRLVFHVETLETARATLAAAFPPPARFRTGEARATLKTTRKFIVPLLEYFDAQGLTLREGDVRRMAVMASGAV